MCSDQERYSRRMILAHWASVVVVVLLLACGFWMVRLAPGGVKLSAYQIHVILGYLLLLVVILRLYFRWHDPTPPPVAGMSHWQRRAARASHWLLYGVLLLLPATGFWMVVQSSLPDAFQARQPHLMPEGLSDEWAALLHWLLSLGLIALILLHLSAVLYHEWVQGDRILDRIGVSRWRKSV